MKKIILLLLICSSFNLQQANAAAYTVGNNINTITTPITLSTLVSNEYGGTVTLQPGDRVTFINNWHFQDKLTIDVVTFVFFDNCDIKCEPEVEIIIDPVIVGNKIQAINLIGAYFYCANNAEMWQGFTSKLNDPSLNTLFINTEEAIIEDAKVAFALNTKNWFNIKKTIFNRNAVGISLLSEIHPTATAKS